MRAWVCFFSKRVPKAHNSHKDKWNTEPLTHVECHICFKSHLIGFKKFNKEKPNLYFTIENSVDKYNFVNMGLELSLYSSTDLLGLDNSVPENVYLNGKISSDRYIYLLKYDSNRPYLYLEYSLNTDLIKVILTTDITSDKSNDFNIKKNETINGRRIMTIQLNQDLISRNPKLYLKLSVSKTLDSGLGYYIFKYMNAKEESEFLYYSLPNSEVTFEKKTNGDYDVNFYPIDNNDVTYYIKAVYNKGRIGDEKKDTIAISESPGNNLQINNPKYEPGKLISFYLNNINEDVSYIKVMAKINSKTQKIFLSYKYLT